MKKIYSKLFLAVLTLCSTVAFAQGDLILTGIFDGPLPGGTPKATEIYVVNDIADMSIYGLSRAANGAVSSGTPAFIFPDTALTAGSYLYVTTGAADFNTYFGMSPNFITDEVNANGDDAIELYKDGVVVDVIGVVGEDGTGMPWEYLDGWMYREDGTGPSATFTLDEWSFSGVDATDGETSNATAANPWPLGTYVYSPVNLILTGIFDGPLPGGTPKATEIYVVNDIPDMSIYGISRAANGAASSGAPAYVFPDTAVTAGSYLYLTTGSADFNTYFGMSPNFITDEVNANGDDAIELYKDGVVVDVIGVVGEDGTGMPWEYLDGWMYREDGTGPNATFTLDEWSFSGVDATDGETSNATAANPWPIGTYSIEGGSEDPVPATIVEIQQTADESGDSPMVGQLVITNGIVTAVDDDGFWIQDGEGAWTGLFIREDNPTVAQGNDVSVTGTVHENFGLTRLVDIMDITVNSEGNALPAATVTTTGTAGVEEYESVLITLVAVTCTDDNIGNGEWEINDGSGVYTVDDDMYNANPVAFMGYDLTGVATYSFNVFKLLPRDAADVVANSGADLLGISFEMGSMNVSETDGTVTVNVTIANPVATETTVNVVVSGGDAVNGTNYSFVDPTTLTFPANSSEAQSFTFTVIDDTEANEDRSVSFDLVNASNGATLVTSTLDVTIQDDDTEVVITPIAVAAAIDANGAAVNNGVEYTVTGIVYGVNMNAAGLSFTINDETGGIGFYSGVPVDGYVVTEGDSVVVTGVVNQFNGLTQMTPSSIELISQGNDLSDPIVITALEESLESHLVKIECVYLTDPSQWTGQGSGFNVTVSNGTTQFAIRIDNDVDLYSAAAPEGTFDVTGLVGQFDSNSPFLEGYQVFPRYVADIVSSECNVEQPPVNDNCNAAINVQSLMGGAVGEMQTSTIMTNENATVSGDPAIGYTCFGEGPGTLENTVWFSFTGDGNAYTIETTNCDGTTTNYIPDGDTQIAIYSGLCALASPVACNEDGPGSGPGEYEAELNLETIAGQTYLMMIDGYSGAQGQFCVAFTRLPLENDECEGAVDISSLTGGSVNAPQTSTIYTNVGATSVGDPNPNDVTASCWFGEPLIAQTVWFQFTGDGETYFIETTNCTGTTEYMTDGDSQMAIFTGDCADLTQVACNEDGPNASAGSYEAAIELATVAGTEYYVMIDGYATTQGQFCMQMTHLDPDGVNEINSFKFDVYPNPSNDVFNIDAPTTIEAATLTNMIGQTVREYSFTSSQRVELNVKGLDAGIYLLQLRSGNKISTAKVIVQ